MVMKPLESTEVTLNAERVQATDLGRIASYYYVTYRTLATYNEHLKPTMGDIELLRLFRCFPDFFVGMS